MNPHFLFNTINDIYVLTYQKNDRAPEALLKLSELLRYTLHDSKSEKMPLSKEVRFLETMVDLQQISAKENAYIIFTIGGDIGDQPVASLLFINFVENAFKHGILSDPQHPVIINLQVDGDRLVFKCFNKKNGFEKDKTGGIGLGNVCRRLELLYPQKHVLNVNDQEESFEIELSLDLSA